MANFIDNGSRWSTVIYRECRMNHFMQEGDRHHAECEEFLGLGKDGQPQETVICATCRCHSNLHRREDTHILLDRTSIQRVHGLACVPRPPPHAVSPRLQVPKIFCLQESVGEREVSVEVDQERRETRRESRKRFTESEKVAMKGYADGLEWSLRGHDKHELSVFCSGIGITVPNFKAWMRNKKKTKACCRNFVKSMLAMEVCATCGCHESFHRRYESYRPAPRFQSLHCLATVAAAAAAAAGARHPVPPSPTLPPRPAPPQRASTSTGGTATDSPFTTTAATDLPVGRRWTRKTSR